MSSEKRPVETQPSTANDDKPAEVCQQLLQSMRTLQLSTVGQDGTPHCGYTPYLFQPPLSIFVFVSQLAAHTRDMLTNGKAAVMIIQDEAASKQLFARTRVTYQCACSVVEVDSTDYNSLLDAYQERQGKMVGLLRQLPDFQLIRLQPLSGQFVMGFGKAYRLSGESLSVFEHTRTG